MFSEDKEILKSILNRTFFKSWYKQKYLEDSLYLPYSNIELQINSFCNLNCKYCYYHKYGKDLYPQKIANKQIVLSNLKTILDWLERNDYYPNIHLFSGELFSQEVGLKSFEFVFDWAKKVNKEITILIPTNFSFILSPSITRRIERILNESKQTKVKIQLSCSIDGKYCDDNRPFKNGYQRTEEYYDKIFKFASKHSVGFHPMIYSQHIEKWIDNFLWFQENFEKHNILKSGLYLLEVRNKEWTKQQLNDFYKFIRFVINWSYKNFPIEPSEFPKLTYTKRLFNIFNMFATTSRGLGCSIQSTIQVRLGDLTVNLCHRTSYDSLNLFKFVKTNNEISDIEPLNLPLLISMYSFKAKNLPFCESCPINELCGNQCLGSMFETNKTNFVPIPSVCALEHIKVKAILDELIDLDLFKHFYKFTPKFESLKLYDKYFKGESKCLKN